MRVLVIGAGKVGQTLARLLRRAPGYEVELLAFRAGLPAKIAAETVLLAVRDAQIEPLAELLAAASFEPRPESTPAEGQGGLVVFHLSGAVELSALDALVRKNISVGQFHPMVSFADAAYPPLVHEAFEGAHVSIAGGPVALQRARALAEQLGLVARESGAIDLALYHAAAALVANGAGALASAGAELLVRAGWKAEDAPQILGPLLRSVAANIEALGLPSALTGPIRRGGVQVVQSHLGALSVQAPEWLPLYEALARAQLPLAAQLKEATPEQLAELERLIGAARNDSSS